MSIQTEKWQLLKRFKQHPHAEFSNYNMIYIQESYKAKENKSDLE